MTRFPVTRATAEFSAACGASAPEDYFAIEVADADTGRGGGGGFNAEACPEQSRRGAEPAEENQGTTDGKAAIASCGLNPGAPGPLRERGLGGMLTPCLCVSMRPLCMSTRNPPSP